MEKLRGAMTCIQYMIENEGDMLGRTTPYGERILCYYNDGVFEKNNKL